MNKFRIQRYQTQVVLPINNDQEDAPNVDQLNGILKGITVVAPDLSGSSFTLSILGQRGEAIFSKASLAKNATTYIGVDANNRPLEIPLSLMNEQPVRIKVAGTTDGTGVLTFDNNGAIVDGSLVTIGNQVYRAKSTLAAAYDFLLEPDVAATAVLTWDNAVNVTDGKKVTAGAVEYTYKTALTDGIVANEVLIGSDGDDSLLNLKKAINAEAGGGVKYGSATVVNPDVSCGAVTAHAVTLTAKVAGPAGNSLAKAEDDAHLDFDGVGATFTGGAWSGDATLANLADAINLEDGSGEAGVKYHADTPANDTVTASGVVAHAITVTAVETVDAPEDVQTLEDSARLAWGAGTLVGGGEAAERTFSVDLLIDRG
jgi:hypothetical protein